MKKDPHEKQGKQQWNERMKNNPIRHSTICHVHRQEQKHLSQGNHLRVLTTVLVRLNLWCKALDKSLCIIFFSFNSKSKKGTIHLRRQHVLGGEGCPYGPMVERSQYIRIKNPLHKHFAGMPMVGGQGSKIVKICRRLKWMVPK